MGPIAGITIPIIAGVAAVPTCIQNLRTLSVSMTVSAQFGAPDATAVFLCSPNDLLALAPHHSDMKEPAPGGGANEQVAVLRHSREICTVRIGSLHGP